VGRARCSIAVRRSLQTASDARGVKTMRTRERATAVLCVCLGALVGLARASSASSDAPVPADDTGSSDLAALVTTLKIGSDESATAALMQLDAEPGLFLDRYELLADAARNAVGVFDKDGLDELVRRHRDPGALRALMRDTSVSRQDLLVTWIGIQIRETPHGLRKEEVVSGFLKLVRGMLASAHSAPDTRRNLLAAFRLSIFYPPYRYVVPSQGRDFAIDLYLEYLNDPDEEVRNEVFSGLCLMGFCSPARQEEIRQTLIEAYPKRARFIQREKDKDRMCLESPPYASPISEEEYFRILQMGPAQLADLYRLDGYRTWGHVRPRIVLNLLQEKAREGDDAAYDALFTIAEDGPWSLRLPEVPQFLARTPKVDNDEQRVDRLLQLVESRFEEFLRERTYTASLMEVLDACFASHLKELMAVEPAARVPQSVYGAGRAIDILLGVVDRVPEPQLRASAASSMAGLCWLSPESVPRVSTAIQEELASLDRAASGSHTPREMDTIGSSRGRLEEALAEVNGVQAAVRSMSTPGAASAESQ